MELISEIEEAKKRVDTDSYPMSIGELINLYQDGDLKINPEYQRLFRWTIKQQSNLIESILIGLPIPPIFVFEKDDGSWELIDGLQRVSTLLTFTGTMIEIGGEKIQSTQLISTKYLKQLNGLTFDGRDGTRGLGAPLQRQFKRAAIGLQILKKGSDDSSKFELFQRLNSFGSPLKPQEFRTCLMVLASSERTQMLRALADRADITRLLGLSEKQISEQQNLDYVCRMLAHRYVDYQPSQSIDEYITESIISIISDEKFDIDSAIKEISWVTERLMAAFGEDALRRIGPDGSASGRVGRVAFEAIFMGVFRNLEHVRQQADPDAYIDQKVREFWASDEKDDFMSSGMTGTARIQKTIPFGDFLFS